MNKIALTSLPVLIFLLALAPARAQLRHNPSLGREIDTINDSVTVINEVMRIPAKSIPEAMFAKAEGLVIVPSMVKGGFGIGGAHGRGIFMTRRPDRGWDAPTFITMTNGSFGFQIGLQAIDVVLIFNTRRSVESFKTGKFTLGVDAAATAGPVGRQASVGTDLTLKSEIYSYSRTRGLFVGAAIDGGVMNLETNSTAAYYNSQPGGALPPGAIALIQTVSRFSGAPDPTLQPGQLGQSGQPGIYPGQSGPAGQLQPDAGAANQNPNNYSDYTIPASGPGNPYPNPYPNQYPNQNQNQNPNPNLASGSNAIPGLSGSAPSAATIAIRKQLSDAYTRLGPMLDPQWQTYLALPSEIFAGPETPDPPREVIQDTLNHYRAVAENSQYQALATRQEFRSVYQLLSQYQQALQAK